jgi:hypothetical protein
MISSNLSSMLRIVGLGCGLLCSLLAGDARAGARPYALVQGIDSLPEGNLELESWFTARRPSNKDTRWDWWFGPVVGITDQLETGLFAIFTQVPPAPAPPGNTSAASQGLLLDSLRLQISYQLAPKGVWPIDVRLRTEVGQPIGGTGHSFWASGIISWDSGPLNVSANVEGWLNRSDQGLDKYIDAALGSSIELFGIARVGGELVGSDHLDHSRTLTAGPTLAFATGRLWVAAHAGTGLTSRSPVVNGRLVLGLLF